MATSEVRFWMPVYEYHPDELARISVVRRATGLTLSEVGEQRRAARDREEQAFAGPGEPRKPSELGIASCQRLEWARIEQVMTKQQMTVYSPDEAVGWLAGKSCVRSARPLRLPGVNSRG
ncbi:hypothetical protein, partial [Streptomyces sp. WAC02707]|uniref:hypothetical protein n=1 Tax=Streptomyces sp. WAC02707 TaxID=2487417 RepID=UPI001C8E0806